MNPFVVSVSMRHTAPSPPGQDADEALPAKAQPHVQYVQSLRPPHTAEGKDAMHHDDPMNEMHEAAKRFGFELHSDAAGLLYRTVDPAAIADPAARPRALHRMRRCLMRAMINATSQGQKAIDVRSMAVAIADVADGADHTTPRA